MAKKFDLVSSDYTEIRNVLSGDVVAGEFVTLTDVNGFYFTAGESGDTAVVITKAGKVLVEKNAGEAWDVGDTIYWDATGENCTITSTSNSQVGYVAEAALSAAVIGYIIFDGYAEFLKT